ncbi:V-type ATPase 116kDa subunit family protein [Candidatus Gugararchaeum adminiculabundum]|nr:V-type ATPase 116kDa subunit family protein [Candidatus Gugararchaeum adminiculabundum]
MFTPTEMCKVRVIAMRDDAAQVIKSLHEWGIMHVEDCSASDISHGKPLESYESISEQLVRIRGIEASLTQQKNVRTIKALPLPQLLQECKKIDCDKRIAELQAKTEEINRRKHDISEKLKLAETLSGFSIDFSQLTASSSRVKFLLGSVPEGKIIALREKLSPLGAEFLVKTHAGKTIALIAVESTADISEALNISGFSEIEMPKFEGKPRGVADKLKREDAAQGVELKEIKRELGKISEKYYERVAQLREMLEIEEQRAEISAKFGATDSLYIVEGWVDSRKLEKFTDYFNRLLTGSVLVKKIPYQEGTAPTLFQNPKAVLPFQSLIAFLTTPKSNEIDPTMVYYLMFPILYGMMLGDVGYGLISMVIAWLIIKKMPGLLADIGKIWMFAAIPTIIFGVIYDEYLGFTHSHLLEAAQNMHLINLESMHLSLPLYHGLHRMTDVNSVLLIILFTGMAYLAIGFFLGFLANWKHNKAHAFAKLAWIGIEVAGVLLVGGFLFNGFPSAWMPYAGALGLISFIYMAKVEGIIGIIELPGFAGNILSFARMLAVGIASVAVAEGVINKMLVPDPALLAKGDIGSILIFILVTLGFIITHLFNTVLGMFESIVQGSRLNYVEVFSKFYKGGGRFFTPFSVSRTYTSNHLKEGGS